MSKISIEQSNKINEIRRSSENRVAPEKSADAQKASGANGSSDAVSFSSLAAEVTDLTARLSNLPDVRSDLVAHYGELLSAHNFNPDSNDIAGALLREEV